MIEIFSGRMISEVPNPDWSQLLKGEHLRTVVIDVAAAERKMCEPLLLWLRADIKAAIQRHNPSMDTYDNDRTLYETEAAKVEALQTVLRRLEAFEQGEKPMEMTNGVE